MLGSFLDSGGGDKWQHNGRDGEKRTGEKERLDEKCCLLPGAKKGSASEFVLVVDVTVIVHYSNSAGSVKYSQYSD